MTLSGFVAYSSALAIAAVIPGPQIVAIVAQALKSGYRQAAWMTAGMVLGDVLYLATVLAGLAFIAETFSALLIVIKWAGVAYLCWLAVQFWRSDERFEGGEGKPAASGKSAFFSKSRCSTTDRPSRFNAASSSDDSARSMVESKRRC